MKVIGQSSASVIFDQQVNHPYSHYSRPSKALNFEECVERKPKRWSSFDEGTADLQGNAGDEPFIDADDEAVDGMVDANVASAALPPNDVKLDFTNFEAP
jgi:hypothetical protein